jgi:hypothetical protein
LEENILKKTWILCLVCAVILSSLTVGIVSASQPGDTSPETVINNILAQDKIANATEAPLLATESDKLETSLNNDVIITINTDGSRSVSDNSIEYVVDFDNMYKVYTLNVQDVKAAYTGNTTFADLISGTYLWEVPIREDSEVISTAAFRKGITVSELAAKIEKGDAAFANDEAEAEAYAFVEGHVGQWYWVRTGNLIPVEEADFVSDRTALANFIIETQLTQIEDIKYVSLGKYRTDIIYIRANGLEYGITFTSHPEFIGLENRTLYPINEIINTLTSVDGLVNNTNT